MKFLITSLLTLATVFVNAQMDDKFYFPKKDLKPIQWKNYIELNFSIEADTVTTIILKPNNSQPKATIFYFHGSGGNLTYYIPITLKMVENNFQVVMIDFRGYGKSTGIPTHKNIAKDGQIVFENLLKRKDIQQTKKIIYGASIGTQIATLIAKNNQCEISGLILEGAMSSFGDIAGFYTPEYKEYLKKNYISPYAAKEDIKTLTQIPKLIIHSKKDKEVPYKQGKIIFENAPKPKTFLDFEGEHLQGMKFESKKILNKISKMANLK
ncbi:MAG: alpha/beta hydrolase [Moheibacter sp.]